MGDRYLSMARSTLPLTCQNRKKIQEILPGVGAVKSTGYPSCLLCKENEGFAKPSHPARQNHRVIPIRLDGEQYFLQYSPYVYYNEHCIIFNENISQWRSTRLYLKTAGICKDVPALYGRINADLPIVGGSILSHDHFQGGGYVFAMAKAPYESEFVIPGYEDLTNGYCKMAHVRYPVKRNQHRADCYSGSHIAILQVLQWC